MVVVPPAPDGAILGSPDNEAGRISNERQHSRRFVVFAIASRETSVREYETCVAAGACRPPEWRQPGGPHNIETGTNPYYRNLGATISAPDQPIVGVSYDDAMDYARWLAAKTGKSYRLPSEGEWEYAARAGSASAYWWGDEVKNANGGARANCANCSGDAQSPHPMPVDSFAPNPWGLYNVHGNVWEWTADYYCEFYDSGPEDNFPRALDNCERRDAPNLRVLRGGSAFYEADKARAASRLRNFPDFRSFSVGFRVARDL